jgi:hypothetical protein
MNHPMFEIICERGPLDGLTLPTNILPEGQLNLPARPDLPVNMESMRQPIEGPVAHYELALGQLKPGTEIPVVQFRFRFKGMSRSGDCLPPNSRRQNWFQRLWAQFPGRRPSIVPAANELNR